MRPPSAAVVRGGPRVPEHRAREARMAIEWKHDLDAELQRASEAEKPVLLDFSAAPM